MSDWLNLLSLELSSIDNYIEPVKDIQPNEHYVGDFTPTLKKLYTLWRRITKATAQSKVDLDFSPDPEEGIQLLAKYTELSTKAGALKSVFWACIQDEFPELWTKPNIAVRRGFKIVWEESEGIDSENKLLDKFRNLFGLGLDLN